MNDERKSGFLTPSISERDRTGLDISVPYYLNLAPNYDLTIDPRYMSKRGLQLRNDFRYLLPTSEGSLAFEYLPNDNRADRTRRYVKFNHDTEFGDRKQWQILSGIEEVSDDAYFEDLGSSLSITSQTHLEFKPAQDKHKVKAELGFNPDDLAIVSVGRLYARKGLFTLIESMPSVTKRFPNAKFIISGKGQSDEMNKLIAHAEKLGVKDNIVFTGYYPDKKLPKLYQAADVFAFSTFYEHHPFAVLEALGNRFTCRDNHGGRHP